MRDYWRAFWAERLRLDARQCRTGYACGSTCISLAKECRKWPESALSRERLQKIQELAEGKRAEGKGLGRLRQFGAAETLAKLEQQKLQMNLARIRAQVEAKEREQEDIQRRKKEREYAAANPPAELKKHLEAVKAQTVVQQGGGATGEAVSAILGALASRPGEEGMIAADTARFIAASKMAIVFSRNTSRAKNTDFLDRAAPVLLASAEKALETTERAKREIPFNMSDPVYLSHARRIIAQRYAGKIPALTSEVKEKLGYFTMYKRAEGLSWRDGHNIAIRDHGDSLNVDIDAMKQRVEDSLKRAKEGRADWTVGYPPQEFTVASVDIGKSAASTPPLKEGRGAPQAELTATNLLHEIGHQIHARATDADGEFTKFSARPFRGEGAVSRYGATNGAESFAEAFVAYSLAPDKLKELYPKTHAWVEERLAKALEGQTRGK